MNILVVCGVHAVFINLIRQIYTNSDKEDKFNPFGFFFTFESYLWEFFLLHLNARDFFFIKTAFEFESIKLLIYID